VFGTPNTFVLVEEWSDIDAQYEHFRNPDFGKMVEVWATFSLGRGSVDPPGGVHSDPRRGAGHSRSCC
jgi:hypothetical protein